MVVVCSGYLRDTKSVLNIVKDIKWKNHFHWITSNIESLYTCIPHRLAIRAVQFHLEKHALYDHATCQYTLSAIDYLLSHNFFAFETGAWNCVICLNFSLYSVEKTTGWLLLLSVSKKTPFSCNSICLGTLFILLTARDIFSLSSPITYPSYFLHKTSYE